ncbi:Rmf/CrpP fold protein [Actinomadura fulvescens]|uniref:Uncharacterized protein n=1 Tax=Actinomadura fulvescens TaxID=46160 RepID=A0ABN3Q6V4_9ACTN
MSITPEDMTRAKRAGRLAARRSLPVTVCPYMVKGTDRDRALAHLWLSAYLAHRPPEPGTVDYSG